MPQKYNKYKHSYLYFVKKVTAIGISFICHIYAAYPLLTHQS